MLITQICSCISACCDLFKTAFCYLDIVSLFKVLNITDAYVQPWFPKNLGHCIKDKQCKTFANELYPLLKMVLVCFSVPEPIRSYPLIIAGSISAGYMIMWRCPWAGQCLTADCSYNGQHPGVIVWLWSKAMLKISVPCLKKKKKRFETRIYDSIN